MPHLGLICPELSGHLNPMTTLGRRLAKRGHRVTLIARPDARRKAESAGLEFAPVGERDYPAGSMTRQSEELGRLSGVAAMKYTVQMLRRGAATMLRDGPAVVADRKIQALIVDQVSPGGSTVADQAKLPYVTVCNALAMNPDPLVPPGVLGWSYQPNLWGRIRNLAGDFFLQRLARPIVDDINAHRRGIGLQPLERGLFGGSRAAQIAQQPAFFDFPRREIPGHFHYTGPWHDPASGDPTPFPWEKLDGRPMIYASMGTLQNRLQHIFATIAAAAEGLEAQLVISLGARRAEGTPLPVFPGAIVVDFAPQLELLERANLTITHAGLNTALESLGKGVPMVAIPITNDQPGVAARLKWLGAGEVVEPRRLNAGRLREAMRRVLDDSSYRENARRYQRQIAEFDGVDRAVQIIERSLK